MNIQTIQLGRIELGGKPSRIIFLYLYLCLVSIWSLVRGEFVQQQTLFQNQESYGFCFPSKGDFLGKYLAWTVFEKSELSWLYSFHTLLANIALFSQDAFLIPNPQNILGNTKLPNSLNGVFSYHFHAPTKSCKWTYPILYKQVQGI